MTTAANSHPSDPRPPSHAHPARGFHGPKCWMLSALVGGLLGLLGSVLIPAPTPAAGHHPGKDQHAPLVRIEQIEPDGSRYERLADFSIRPLPTQAEESGGTAPAPAQESPSSTAPPTAGAHHSPAVPLWLCLPFVLLLGSIAVFPLLCPGFWHRHYPDVSFFLGAAVLVYYTRAFGSAGGHAITHAGIEYYAFIALVGGLYVASGGILIDIRARGRASTNTLLLACGCVLANIVGTTGASVLLIRPFLRMNEGRMRPLHAVFFIYIVSNCAGCLTPIGDPPLYLGYLKGVPFSWTLTSLWPMWLTVNGLLLAMFFLYDLRVPRAGLRHMGSVNSAASPSAGGVEPETRERVFDPSHRGPIIIGWPAMAFLALLVAGVFVDPVIAKLWPDSPLVGWPVGATYQVAMAIAAFFSARPSVRHANEFSFEPVKEVGFLFAGIFLTMVPALAYLQANASELGLESPTQFYFATGILSAVLDNAPTYASFLQAALGVLHIPLSPDGIETFIRCAFDVVHVPPMHSQVGGEALASAQHVRFEGSTLLRAISLGAVFFGAMSYIGNGPNFMVRAIVDAAHRSGEGHDTGKGVRMPSFFGYVVYALAVLLPVLIINWLVWIR